ncbi:MAG: nitrile hydratase alpha subunit [Parasphingorhabdus sp.]|jgi:nitrile hydratase alpha subunit
MTSKDNHPDNATHSHGHDHPHDHAPPPDHGPVTQVQAIQIALQELLIEKNIVSAGEIREMVELIDSITPSRGAEVVAKAWLDPEFKSRLLQDGTAACQELGIDLRPTPLVVVENTRSIHNVIVCTLCSCYPRMLLGLPPDWYKSTAYRSRVVVEPRAVLEEFGTQLDPKLSIRVHDSTADMRYMVLPRQPDNAEGFTEQQLMALVTRDCMIGVVLPTVPVSTS